MKLLRNALAATALAIGLAGPAVAQDIRIIVVSHGQANDPFWSVVKNGVAAGAEDAGVAGRLPRPRDLRHGRHVAADRRRRQPEARRPRRFDPDASALRRRSRRRSRQASRSSR